MAQEINLDININGSEKAINNFTKLRNEIKDAKSELTGLLREDIIDVTKVEAARKKVGELTDKLKEVNETIAVASGGSSFEKISNGLGLIGGQLKDLDFKGAADNAKLLNKDLKNIDPKELKDGFKAFATTIGEVGKTFFKLGAQLLLNPLFLIPALIVGAIAAIVLLKDKIAILGKAFDFLKGIVDFVIKGLKNLTDQIGLTTFADDEATEKFVENSKKKREANKKYIEDRTNELNREIELAKAQGKNAEELEIKRQKLIEEGSAKRQLELKSEREELKKQNKRYNDDINNESVKANNEKLKEINDSMREENKIYLDAKNEQEVIRINYNKKDLEDEKKKNEKIKEYNKIRLDVQRQLQDLYVSNLEEGLTKELMINQIAYDRKVQDTKNNEKLLASEKIALIKSIQKEKEKADKIAYDNDAKLRNDNLKKQKEDELKFKNEMKKIKEDYNSFIINETGTSLDKELNEVKIKYDNQRDALKKALDERLITQSEYNQKSIELTIAQANAIDKIRKTSSNNDAKTEEETYQKKINTILLFVNSASSLLSSLNGLINQQGEQRLFDIQTQLDAENNLNEQNRANELSNTNLSEEQKNAINNKYNQLKYKNELEAFKKSEEIKKKQFERDKALRMVNVVMDTAAGVMRGYGEVGPIAGAILAGLTIATGAIQLATIASQKYQGATGPSAPANGSFSGGQSQAVTPSFTFTGNKNEGSTATASQSVEANRNTPIVRAYVSETEISGVQNRVRRIEQSAEL